MGIDPGLDPVTLGLLASSGLGSCHGTVEGRLWVLSGYKSRTNQCPQSETWLGHANDLYGRIAVVSRRHPVAAEGARTAAACRRASGARVFVAFPKKQRFLVRSPKCEAAWRIAVSFRVIR